MCHFRRVPGPLRRGLVHRQGDLRRRRVRGGLDGPRPGERHAEPRPLRGRVRARRPRQRRRALRARPLALRRGLRASAPMGTRRLAAAAVDLRLGIPLDPGDRALEDARQPPAHPVGAGGAAHAGCRLDASGAVARRLDRVRPGDHRAPDTSARAHRRHPARPRDLQAQPRACRRPGPRPRRLADGVRDDAAGVPGLADDRRDRADGGPRRRDPSQAAGMDDRGAGESRAAPGPARLLPADGRRRHPGLRRRGPQRVGSSGGVAHRAPVSPALGGVTGGRSLEQPAVAGRAHEGALGCGGARAQADRAPHLALLHDVRRRRSPCAASRQLPGRSEPGGRPPDVADESRALPAGHGGRARFRLARDRGHRRATRGDASDDDGSRALSRPLLQLVRHAGPARARSPLRLVGGQRKSRRASDHARPRLRELIDGPRPGAALAGIADAVSLVRESLNALADRGRVLAVARRLEGALDIMAAAIESSVHTPGAWAAWLAELEAGARMVTAIARSIAEEDAESAQPVLDWAEALRGCVDSHLRDLQTPAPALAERLAALAERAQTLVAGMDFTFLFDSARKLFSIGYRVSDGTLDPGRYDLLASEARLTSFLTIARGDVPVSHWFRLGRALTPVESDSVLVSWSGSMFEYLMPALVMRVPAGSLLAQTGELVVARQISYGAERGVPWGVSESSYNVRDLEMTYQYSNFGVPGLGLRFGLVDDVVIAPYATGLAAMIDPSAAVQNFRRLEEAGALGAYGFYDALDYTAQRRPEGTGVAIVRTYMAHHQGMVIVAIANVLHDGAMPARVHAEPNVQATELLLQERTPRDVAVTRPRRDEVSGAADVRELVPAVVRRFTSPHAATPRTHLLSNGRYAVMMTAAGSGYSRFKSLAITRWRDDVTRDLGGTYVFLRNVQSGETWSAGYQPTPRAPDRYEVRFAEDRVEIVRRDRGIATTLEVIVSPEDDAEMRRVSLTNHGTRTREIDVTSYAEVVLAEPEADAAHPAFSNLFVRTEALPELDALLATRRARSGDETPVWLAHVARVEGEAIGALQWETDRARFLGRGRGIGTPQAILDGGPLSNTVGTVLDPIVSLRHRVRLRPGQTVRVVFSTLVAPSRDEAVALADKYRDAATFDRAATLAWTQAQVQLHHLGVKPDEAHLFQSLAAHILYPQRTLRASADVLARHAEGPAALWAHGISGDTPIVLVRIDEVDDVEIVRQLLRAHEYWRMKQLAVDLGSLNGPPRPSFRAFKPRLETAVGPGPPYAPPTGGARHAAGSSFAPISPPP